MKRLIIFILLFTCTFSLSMVGQAQVNYVLNASLEQYTHCPTTLDQIRYATYWSQIDTAIIDPLCSPEYCNACANINSGVSVPGGGFYYHYPRTGNGMVEVVMYSDQISMVDYQRDYLQGRLYKSLTAGTSYCVTFYVTLEQASYYAVNNIGAYLDNGGIDAGQDTVGCASPQTAFTPQFFETSVIADTINWVKVQGSFIANGTEKFITIGNFFDNVHTNEILIVSSPGGYGLYLVDDISVIESTEVAHAGPDVAIAYGDSVHIGTSEEGMPCTWYVLDSTKPIGYSGGIWVKPDSTTSYVVEMDLCGHVTYDTVKVTVWPVGIKPLLPKKEPSIWPNPAKDELTVENATGVEMRIYNLLGQKIYKTVISDNIQKINVADLLTGIYIIEFVNSNGMCKKIKLFKQ